MSYERCIDESFGRTQTVVIRIYPRHSPRIHGGRSQSVRRRVENALLHVRLQLLFDGEQAKLHSKASFLLPTYARLRNKLLTLKCSSRTSSCPDTNKFRVTSYPYTRTSKDMLCWTDLPQKALSFVLEWTRPADIKTMSLVCKQYPTTAQALLFSSPD